MKTKTTGRREAFSGTLGGRVLFSPDLSTGETAPRMGQRPGRECGGGKASPMDKSEEKTSPKAQTKEKAAPPAQYYNETINH